MIIRNCRWLSGARNCPIWNHNERVLQIQRSNWNPDSYWPCKHLSEINRFVWGPAWSLFFQFPAFDEFIFDVRAIWWSFLLEIYWAFCHMMIDTRIRHTNNTGCLFVLDDIYLDFSRWGYLCGSFDDFNDFPSLILFGVLWIDISVDSLDLHMSS